MNVKVAVFAALLLGASSIDGPSTQPDLSKLPWVTGLWSARITDRPIPTLVERSGEFPDEPLCAPGAYQELELVADVAPEGGYERVRVSFANGIEVRDREGMIVASSAGYNCEGSVDEVSVLATGSAVFDPTIVLAVTRGGHREQTTELALFRVGFGGRIDPVFTGLVEHRQDTRVRRGAVRLFAGGLIYQRPEGGPPTIWIFDPIGRAYLYRGSFGEHAEPPHAEPPPVASLAR